MFDSEVHVWLVTLPYLTFHSTNASALSLHEALIHMQAMVLGYSTNYMYIGMDYIYMYMYCTMHTASLLNWILIMG